MLASSGVTVTAGAGLSGGGAVSLGGTVSLSAADLAGDVTGGPGGNTVTALQGSPVAATTPAHGQVMAWSAGAGAWVPTTLVIPQLATYRFAVFNTYDQASGWMANNDPALFGGIAPSNWTDSSAIASQLSADKEVLRTLYNRKGYAGANALVHAESFVYTSSTDGKVVTALFRIRNTTAAAITWTPVFRVTAYGAWGEQASVALNGVSAWTSAGGTYFPGSGPVSVALAIPPSRTSTAIFVSTGCPPGARGRGPRSSPSSTARWPSRGAPVRRRLRHRHGRLDPVAGPGRPPTGRGRDGTVTRARQDGGLERIPCRRRHRKRSSSRRPLHRPPRCACDRCCAAGPTRWPPPPPSRRPGCW